MADLKTVVRNVRAVPKDAVPHRYNAARCHMEIGFLKLGEQEPHFYALAGVEGQLRNGRWEGDLGRFACCANHDALRAHFPEYVHLARWHSCGIESGPMHYEANAVYWSEMAQGKRAASEFSRVDPIEAFKRTVVFGALPPLWDTGEPWLLPAAELSAWLRDRLPALMAQFRKDVEAAFPGMWDRALALGKE